MITIEIINDAKSADFKSTISSSSLHLAVKIKIAIFTAYENKPRVIKIAGRVNHLTIKPKMPVIRPKRSATQISLHAPPFTSTPEIKVVAA